MSALRVPVLALATLSLVAGCARDETEATGDSAAGVAAPAEFSRAASVQAEFKTPEAVRFDPTDDVFFVSNINGSPGEKDNNGFISRVRAEGGEVDSLMFIAGGRGGVTLHAPKGLAITGDTLWVTDIDAVRAFNKRTGQAIASYPVQGAVFLNDIAAGPDGALYITDTGIRIAASGMSHPGPDRVFKLTRAGQVSTALQFDSLIGPNGIAWDDANQRFIVVHFAVERLLRERLQIETRLPDQMMPFGPDLVQHGDDLAAEAGRPDLCLPGPTRERAWSAAAARRRSHSVRTIRSTTDSTSAPVDIRMSYSAPSVSILTVLPFRSVTLCR